MSTTYPPQQGGDSELLDSIYDMSVEEEEFIASALPHLQHEYALFSTGCKLVTADAGAVLPSDRDIFELWQKYTAYQRAEMMTVARNRPDPRLRHENFELRQDELEAVNGVVPAETTMLRYYLVGRKIQRGTEDLPDSQIMLTYWNENFRPAMAESRHPEAENLGTYIQCGKHHTERRDRKAARLPPSTLYQDHVFLTTARKAASDNDVNHVNESMAESQYGWRWMHEKMLYNQPHISLQRGGHAERSVHLFVLVDDQGIIRKRMTVKIIGDDDKARLRHTIKCETRPHEKLTNLSCPHVVDLYASSFREREITPHLGYIYTEYAPFGNLHALVGKLRYDQSKQIPEPYLWVIFRALAEALHAMHTGRVIEKNTPPHMIGRVIEGWRPVVNPDIKLANVVLAAAKDDYYPAYKTAKIIDFGQVFPDKLVVDGVVRSKYSCGTELICPPEQFVPCPQRYEDVPIGVHSEIYNLGLIMCSLTQGIDKERLTPDNPRFPPGYNGCYSARLEGVITQCLQDVWDRRPTLSNLLAQIDVGLASWEKVYGSANRKPEELPEFMRFDWAEEEYPVGSEAPEDWAGPRKGKEVEDVETGEQADFSSEASAQEETPSKKRKAETLEKARKKVCPWLETLMDDGEPPVSPPPLRDMYILHCYKGDTIFTSDSSSDDEEFGFRFRRRDRDSLVEGATEKMGKREKRLSLETAQRGLK